MKLEQGVGNVVEQGVGNVVEQGVGPVVEQGVGTVVEQFGITYIIKQSQQILSHIVCLKSCCIEMLMCFINRKKMTSQQSIYYST